MAALVADIRPPCSHSVAELQSTADGVLGKPELRQFIRPKNITHVDDHGRSHQAADPRKINTSELLPFSHNDDNISAARNCIWIGRDWARIISICEVML
jgi:hypothetical protein